MNLNQVAMGQPQLSQLLLGYSNQKFIANLLFPQVDSALTTMLLGRVGNEAQKRYDLKRAPGTKTKSITLSYSGRTYNIDNHAVNIPIPREWIEEQDALAAMNQLPLSAVLRYGNLAVNTAGYVLGMEYEAESAELAFTESLYGSTNVSTLGASEKWSKDTSKPVDAITNAIEAVRKGSGSVANSIMLSASSFNALKKHPQVLSKLPSTNLGLATLEQLQKVFDVKNIYIGSAIMFDANDVPLDIWGDNAIVFYNPPGMVASQSVNMVEPVFSFTGTKKNGIYIEKPFYDNESKSWIYGASYDRSPNICSPKSGFLIKGTV